MITDDELSSLRTHVESRRSAFEADLEQIVNIDCGSYSKSGVDQIGAWVISRLESLGATVRTESHDRFGDTVVGVIDGSGTTRVLLIGHMDTVFADGTVAERPYNVRDGRAHGPGTDDMKGGLLAGLYALDALRSTAADGRLPFGRLTFVANPDEEIGSPTSTPVIRGIAPDVDVCFVLEAARENGNIVSARKGIADFVVEIHGRAAHAGVEPEKGRSAIVEAAHKTLALTALNGRWPGVTVNVGVIGGGTRPNVVAESCAIEIDLRGTARADMEAAESAIREIAQTPTVADVTSTITRRNQWWPMEKTPPTAALAKRAIELAGRLGFDLADTSTGGASDANTTSGMGIPTLDGLGPIGGNAHAASEYMELDSIVPRTTLLAALMLSVARETPSR
ncbi:MAG: M20 family metallopeptidase [Candidatus Limnocylindrales bacterium]